MKRIKTKKFDYKKHGAEIIDYVEHGDGNSYTYWAREARYLAQVTDGVSRCGEQWRRIYYTAKRKKREADFVGPKCTITYFDTVYDHTHESTANRLSEINKKVDECLSKLETCLQCFGNWWWGLQL